MNNTHQNWMAMTPEIGTLRIDQLILPGSHNSGMDKQSPDLSLPQEITQDVHPLAQVKNGIRVLDLRIALYKQYPVDSPERFQIYHHSSSGRTIEVDILAALAAFYSGLERAGEIAREVVILNFHQFRDFNDQGHEQLCALITRKLGHRLIPYDLRDMTLNEIWTQHAGKNVVIAYNHGAGENEFWDGVEQRWSGSNLNTTEQLKVFMDSTVDLYKPDHQLVAIQCAKYVLPFHVPDDFSNKIDEWFASESPASYIQKFYIINTDWSLRSNIVSNCIHANIIRAGNA